MSFLALTADSPRPPLKWAGGKRWLVPHLRPLWDSSPRLPDGQGSRRLVEPFCGGLAMALGLGPASALLNDINPHLINFYRWLARGLSIGLDMRNDAQTYYRHRDSFNRLLQQGRRDSQEAAELFYYLNRTGYNGLCRFNRSGLFNVPFGRYKTIRYTTDFAAFTPILSPWRFTCQDFEMLPVEPSDFIYADPPYDVEFRQYAKDGFEWPEQVTAGPVARTASGARGPVQPGDR